MGPFRPSMMDGPHNIPSLATVSLLAWSLALARNSEFCRAFNTNHSTIEYVSIYHCGFYITMAKRLLDRMDVITSLQ